MYNKAIYFWVVFEKRSFLKAEKSEFLKSYVLSRFAVQMPLEKIEMKHLAVPELKISRTSFLASKKLNAFFSEHF